MTKEQKIGIGAMATVFVMCSLCGLVTIAESKSTTETCEPRVVTKEVVKEIPEEKIVYQDDPATIEQLEAMTNIACAYASMYPGMYGIVVDYADIYGLGYMITQDIVDLNTMSIDFTSEYCQ